MSPDPTIVDAVRLAAAETPYRVVEQPYGFDLTLDIVDARWLTLFKANGLRRVFTHEVRLEPAKRRFTVTDVANELRWDAGTDGALVPSLHVLQKMKAGRIHEVSFEKQIGFSPDSGRVETVVDYRFDSGAGRAMITRVLEGAGWKQAWSTEMKIGLVGALLGGGVALTVAVLLVVFLVILPR